jgi:hypothetical protein
VRSAEGVLVPALFSYAVQEFGKERFDEAWDEFFLWNDAPDDVEGSREFGLQFDELCIDDRYAATGCRAAQRPRRSRWRQRPARA